MFGCEKVFVAFNYRPSYDITGTQPSKNRRDASTYLVISNDTSQIGFVMQFCPILADGINVLRMMLIDQEWAARGWTSRCSFVFVGNFNYMLPRII